MKEHYDIELGASSIRRILFAHAENLYENESLNEVSISSQPADWVIAEMDGCMIPIV